MRLLGMPDARERLDPVMDALLVQPCKRAVSEWNQFIQTVPGHAAAISPTTRAGIIHDFTTRAVRGALTEGVRELSGYGFFVIAVGNDLAVRYKYVVSGQPRNVATEKQALLARHQYDDTLVQALALDGIEDPPTLVTCGYRLSADGEISSLSVQCDYGRTTLWHYLVYGDPGVAGNYETLPLDPTDTLGTTIVRSSSEEARRSDRDAQ